MTSCPHCAELRGRLGRIRELVEKLEGLPPKTQKAPPKYRQYVTPHGKLIDVAARAKGITLADLSRELSDSKDYVARVCRDTTGMTRHNAVVIGHWLGIDLLPYVRASKGNGSDPELFDQVAV